MPSDQVAYSLIGASWGGQITDRALIALGVFLLLVTLVIWAYFRNWKMSRRRPRRAAARPGAHRRHLRPGRLHRHAGDGDRRADHPGLLAVRHGGRLRQGARERPRPHLVGPPDLLRGRQPGRQPGAGALDQHHHHRCAAGGGAALRRGVHPRRGPAEGPGPGPVRRHDLGRLLLDLHRHPAARPAQGAGAGDAEARPSGCWPGGPRPTPRSARRGGRLAAASVDAAGVPATPAASAEDDAGRADGRAVRAPRPRPRITRLDGASRRS